MLCEPLSHSDLVAFLRFKVIGGDSSLLVIYLKIRKIFHPITQPVSNKTIDHYKPGHRLL